MSQVQWLLLGGPANRITVYVNEDLDYVEVYIPPTQYSSVPELNVTELYRYQGHRFVWHDKEYQIGIFGTVDTQTIVEAIYDTKLRTINEAM